MVKHCIVCGKEFETSGNRKICYDRHIKICEVCGKEFELKWPYTQKTCSDSKCRAQHTRSVATSRKRICELCGKEFIPNSPRQKFCTEAHFHKCEICGLQKWNNQKIPLELHHINGNNKDNSLNNLQLLCPNCHALTDNYRNRK